MKTHQRPLFNTLSILLILAALSFSTKGFSQLKSKDFELVSVTAKIAKFHTTDELNKMTKATLIQLYKERFRVAVLLMPYSGLTNKPGTTLDALGIPVTSDNKNMVEKEDKAGKEYHEIIDKNLSFFIAYADKSSIVWSIIMYEEIIRKINLGREF